MPWLSGPDGGGIGGLRRSGPGRLLSVCGQAEYDAAYASARELLAAVPLEREHSAQIAGQTGRRAPPGKPPRSRPG
jgi:hypothetical protein